MNFVEYKALTKQIKLGKSLPTAIYIHKSALEEALPDLLHTFITNKLKQFKVRTQWNVLKLYKRDFKLSLLCYPDFDTYAYPALQTSLTFDLLESAKNKTDFSKSDNPPILHRKEAFISKQHPQFDEFAAITKEGEAIGLYENTKTIGFKNNWEKLIAKKGYELDEKGRLFKSSPDTPEPVLTTIEQPVQRQKTAINRDRLSAPFQKLARYGYLNGEHTILDYGCGLQDDLRELEAHGLNINGWDPNHYPGGNRVKSDIVNLGFVLNVIEDIEERTQTLKAAFNFTNKLLVVSVMLAGAAKTEQFKPYKDGVITKLNTFQKYYNQSQIRDYIEQTLKVTTVVFGQGIIAVFKDKAFEEEYYLSQQFNDHNWQHITQRPIQKAVSKAQQRTVFEKNQLLLNDFWQQTLYLGRIPSNDEFEQSDLIRQKLQSHNKAFELCLNNFEQGDLQLAQQKRKDDLLTYFALSLFGKRKAKSHMPTRIHRDIKAHFESYNVCLEAAQTHLYSVGNPLNIARACYQAFEQFKLGEFIDSHSYAFPLALLNKMPVEIRVYVGCAGQLYGDFEGIDLIKVHMRSGKVTLLKYDDFTKPLPLLTERIKIKLLELDIDFFIYGDEYPYKPHYNKLAYLKPNTKAYKTQLAFDKKLNDMLKGIPKTEWPDWPILQKVFEYWKVELKGDKFYKN